MAGRTSRHQLRLVVDQVPVVEPDSGTLVASDRRADRRRAGRRPWRGPDGGVRRAGRIGQPLDPLDWSRSATASCTAARLYAPTVIDDEVVANLEDSPRWRRCTTRPPPRRRGGPRRCPTSRRSPSSTPRSSTTCRRPRRPTRWTGIARHGTFGGTGSTGRRTSTSPTGGGDAARAAGALNQIVLHLGNGASASAVAAVRSRPRWA